jgi:hypothetical protein
MPKQIILEYPWKAELNGIFYNISHYCHIGIFSWRVTKYRIYFLANESNPIINHIDNIPDNVKSIIHQLQQAYRLATGGKELKVKF